MVAQMVLVHLVGVRIPAGLPTNSWEMFGVDLVLRAY